MPHVNQWRKLALIVMCRIKQYSNLHFKHLLLIMRILFLIITFSTVMLFGCKMDTSNKKENGECVINTTEFPKERPIFSVSMLQGTTWIADYSNEERVYKMTFTDTKYICDIVFPRLGKAKKITYPYYLSPIRSDDFEWKKVGTGTKGDFLISYDKNGRKKVYSEELLWISPTKLVLVRQQCDTISFTRK